MKSIVTVSSSGVAVRVGVLAVVLVVLFCTFVGVRWQLAEMLATTIRPTDENAAEAALIARSWSPDDPQVRFLAAASAVDDEVPLYEDLVEASPHDSRWRVELGRAYERVGNYTAAELQLRRAVDLAPNHAVNRWHLGNFFLRRGNTDQAMEQLRVAALRHPGFRDQVYVLLWDYFGNEVAPLHAITSGDGEATAYLALFFAARGRAADAVSTWERLDAASRERFQFLTPAMADGLLQRRAFREALTFYKDAGVSVDVVPGKVSNPSFEQPLTNAVDPFGWTISRVDPRLEVTVDARTARTGSRSARVNFRGFSKPALAVVSQNVVVDPSVAYALKFSLRTEALKSAGMPILEIVDAVTEERLGSTQPYSAGTSDWQMVEVRFTTRPTTSAINIRTARANCGEECPIFGTFWYDDFELIRL
jgi:hypothetical protein